MSVSASRDAGARNPGQITPKITTKKLSDEKRAKLTQDIIEQLESQSTPENDHKLAIYKYIDRVDRSTREERFSFFACQRLRVVRKCPHGDYRRVMRRMYCRQRFFCLACEAYRMKCQVDDWLNSIKLALQTTNLYLGPIVELSWEIPDVSNATYRNRFSKYINDNWKLKLGQQGIAPGTWILLRHYDVIRGQVRAVYLGPPLDCESLRNKSPSEKLDYSVSCFSRTPALTETSHRVKRGKRGNFSPWQPIKVRSTYLLDGVPKLPSDVTISFFPRLRSALEWVAGSVTDVLELTPERAYDLRKRYSGKHLYACHGVTYALPKAPANLQEAGAAPVLGVESKELNGSIELVLIDDPMQFIGSVTDKGALPLCISTGAHPSKCPSCGSHLVDVYEEAADERHARALT